MSIWILAILVSIPFLFMVEYTENPVQCVFLLNRMDFIYIAILYALLIFLPVIGLSFLYIYIIIKLKKHFNSFKHNSPSNLCSMDRQDISSQKQHHLKNGEAMSNTSTKSAYEKMRIHYVSSIKRKRQTIDLTNDRQHESNFSLNSISSLDNHQLKNSRKRASNICSTFNCFCLPLNDSFGTTTAQTSIRLGQKSEKVDNYRFLANNNNNSTFLKNSSLSSSYKVDAIRKPRTYSLQSRSKLRNSLLNNTFNNSTRNTLGQKINFTVVISMVALAFFFCQIPIRIFLLYSYYINNVWPLYLPVDELSNNTLKDNLTLVNSIQNSSSSIGFNDSHQSIQLLNFVSYFTTFIYFLHCISNPIIYNLISIKFRNTFLSLSRFRTNHNMNNQVTNFITNNNNNNNNRPQIFMF